MSKLWVFLALLAAPLAAQQYPIVELHANGSELFDEAEITAYAGLKVDKQTPVAVTAVRDAAQRLVQSGAFKTVAFVHSAVAGGMKVEFQVTDKADDQFLKADFSNLVWFTPAEVEEGVKARVPLYNGYIPLDGALQDEVRDALTAMLADEDVHGHVGSSLLFPLNEGPAEAMMFTVEDVRIVLARVEVPGASEAFLRPMETALQKMIGQPYFADRMRNFTAQVLLPIYRAKGYLKATFAPPVATILTNEPGITRVAVALTVKEGRAYTLSGVRWAGNKAISETELGRLVHVFPGLPMNAELFERELDKVRFDYATLGYLQMKLEAQPVFDDAAGEVRYELLVREGPLFRMGKLEFEGLTDAQAESLRQQFKLREGEPFDLTYVRNFFSRLPVQGGSHYRVEQSEGETPHTVDLTFVICRAGEPCQPTKSTLYTPSKKEDE
jgi:outer membrane protein assembly factor BamA